MEVFVVVASVTVEVAIVAVRSVIVIVEVTIRLDEGCLFGYQIRNRPG